MYRGRGHAYLVCPALLVLDPRHGEHSAKGKPCRQGKACLHEHEHEEQLLDPEGHSVVDFYWSRGARPLEAAEWPVCGLCGRPLIHTDLDDPTEAPG